MRTSQPAVARLETHQHDPQLSTLARYVTALGLSLEFVLTDNATGTQVWSSRQGLQQDLEDETVGEVGQVDDAAEAGIVRYGFHDVKVVDGTWVKVSERDVEDDLPVLAQSAEPGWTVLYLTTHESQAPQAAASAIRHTEVAEDPRVLGVFDESEPDPISIAPATSFAKPRAEQALTLLAKFRNAELEGIAPGSGPRWTVVLNSLLPRIGTHYSGGEIVRPAHAHVNVRSVEARIGIVAPDPDVQYDSLNQWLSAQPGLDIFVVGAAGKRGKGGGIEALIVL